jgi:hypothetical protein
MRSISRQTSSQFSSATDFSFSVGEEANGEVTNRAADPGDFTQREGEYWGRSDGLGERAES